MCVCSCPFVCWSPRAGGGGDRHPDPGIPSAQRCVPAVSPRAEVGCGPPLCCRPQRDAPAVPRAPPGSREAVQTLPLHGGDGGRWPGTRPGTARAGEAAAAAQRCSCQHLPCPAPLAGVKAERAASRGRAIFSKTT